jgi:hypothetical protein
MSDPGASRTIATVSLLVIAIALMLAQYWYSFGLWPRSWAAFISISACQILLQHLLTVVKADY